MSAMYTYNIYTYVEYNVHFSKEIALRPKYGGSDA